MNSQLHSFTAMVFGVSPVDVTDGQIHFFLRLFVFIPAIGAAFAATIIALTTVTRIRFEPPVEIGDRAGEYILGPLAEGILRQATDDHIRSLHARVPTAA
jgi:hypothetical protein